MVVPALSHTLGHSAKAACKRARLALGRLAYATSRVSACLIAYSRSPAIDEPERWRMKSLSSSATQSGSSPSKAPEPDRARTHAR